jgi:hypothetical protein
VHSALPLARACTQKTNVKSASKKENLAAACERAETVHADAIAEIASALLCPEFRVAR